MKRFELAFTFFQLPLDYLMLLLAGASAYGLRFNSFITKIRPVQFNLPWTRFWPALLAAAFSWLVIFALTGLYSTNPNRKYAKDLARVVMACSTGFAAITMYIFFALQRFDSRFLVVVGWFLAIIYVALGRLGIRALKSLLYRLGIGLRRVVIIGREAVAETIARTFASEPRLGCQVAKIYGQFDETTALDMMKRKPDEIIFTDPRAEEENTLSAIDFANEHHLAFKYSADLFSTLATNLSVSTIAGIPIIELRRTRLNGWGRIFKRFADIIGSLILLIVSTPFYLIIAVIILLETGRPVIYRNQRVGQHDQKFFTLKFRSMYQKDSTGPGFGGKKALQKEAALIKTNGIKAGPVYKIANDPRVTRFGNFLRRWSLDELPQFWNVLKGQMSLVGPRPHQPREVNQYQKHHKILLAIKPGITGLAQISGRSDLTFEEEARLDTFYIENWSLYLDLIILIKTPFVVLIRKGAR